MKKIQKLLTKRKASSKPAPSRITNETVAEHRERILAGGKRFKYPIQYTKHKLVVNAVLIGLTVLITFVVFSWWQLYKVQTTDEFFYRLTRALPLPAAKVDGEDVKYGDYLLNYKISETYLNTVERADQNKYADGASSKSIYDFYKAQAMNNAVADAYARKIANEQHISISDQQVDQAIKNLLQTTSSKTVISQQEYDRANERLYGLSVSENRYYLRQRLLRQEVSYKIDTVARTAADRIGQELQQKPDMSFDELAKLVPEVKPQVMNSGIVAKENKDGGLAAAAAKLKVGQASGLIRPLSGDGYYFVRLLETNKDGEINYQSIKIPLSEFKSRVQKLHDQHKITYYISVPESKPQVKTTK